MMSSDFKLLVSKGNNERVQKLFTRAKDVSMELWNLELDAERAVVGFEVEPLDAEVKKMQNAYYGGLTATFTKRFEEAKLESVQIVNAVKRHVRGEQPPDPQFADGGLP